MWLPQTQIGFRSGPIPLMLPAISATHSRLIQPYTLCSIGSLCLELKTERRKYGLRVPHILNRRAKIHVKESGLLILIGFGAVFGYRFKTAAHMHFLTNVFYVSAHGFGADVQLTAD